MGMFPPESRELRSTQCWDCRTMLEVPDDRPLMGLAKLKFSLISN